MTKRYGKCSLHCPIPHHIHMILHPTTPLTLVTAALDVHGQQVVVGVVPDRLVMKGVHQLRLPLFFLPLGHHLRQKPLVYLHEW